MPNGSASHEINRFNRYYSYRFQWHDGYYLWQNCRQPSPYGAHDDEESVEHKEMYWVDYFKIETIVSIKERRLLPKKLHTHKIIEPIARFLGTVFDVFSDDVIASSTLPGSALPGRPFAV